MRLFGEDPLPSSDDWYTPPPVVEAARTVMGGIDLDPASCAEANRVVRATTWWDETDSPLTRRWFGRVWLNPPFGLMSRFGETFRYQWESGHLTSGCMLVVFSPSNLADWVLDSADSVCFLPRKLVWWGPRAEAAVEPTPWNFQRLAVAGFGVDQRRFRSEFDQIGPVR